MVKLILLGFGSVNQVLLQLFTKKKNELQSVLKQEIKIVGASDSKGAVYNNHGIPIDLLLSVKKEKKSVIYYSGNSTTIYSDALSMIKDQKVEYDILIDGSPVNLNDGSPGLQCSLCALRNGKKVILANKAPLVLAFDELHEYASNLRYSAAVCGGLPVVNVLKHDLMAPYLSTIHEISGIFNSTTNYILTQLTQHIDDNAVTMQTALKEAQEIGIAETDPTLDINGSDTANKLVIIMNILGQKVKFKDIERSGLEMVNKQMIVDAAKQGMVYRLVARGKREGMNRWILSVKCEMVEEKSFLGQCTSTDMCIQIESDLFDTQFYKTNEKDVVGTSAAVMRDLVSLVLRDETYSVSKL